MKRMIVVPWLLWAVGIGIAMGFVLYAGQVRAALSYRAEGANGQIAGLRLSEAPCTNEKVRAHIEAKLPTQYHDKFKAAVLTWNGRDWHSCWLKVDLVDQNDKTHVHVLSIDEEGAPFNPPYGIPLRMFREDSI